MRINEKKPVRIRSHSLILACICITVLGGIHCGEGEDRAYSRESTITVLYRGDERVLGPFWGVTPQFLVFLPLVTRNAKGELEGRLAERWEHSADYRTWTIHLRKNVLWQDGVRVTAHDIKFTLDLLSHPEVLSNPPGAYSITVLDDSTYTITFHKQTKYGPFSDYRVYYPKHLLKDLDPKEFYDWEFWIHPVGNGPYRYVRHIPKTMIELEANPEYYKGKPKIERVVLKFLPSGEGEPSLIELVSGNVDAITYINRMDLLKFMPDPRFQVYHGISHIRLSAIAWNQRHPFFGDPRVRRALTMAINRRDLHQVLNLPEGTPLFDVIFTNEQLQGGVLPEPLPYDPKLANQLLAEAGWGDRGSDGVRVRDGKTFRFTSLVEQRLTAASVYIQAQLRRVGVRMDVQVLDNASAEERIQAGEFEAAVFIFYNNVFDHLRFFGDDSPIAYSPPRVLAHLRSAEATWDPNKVDRAYRDLWPIFQADLPLTFLSPFVATGVAHRRVQGLSSPWRIDPVRYMDELWLED